MEAQNLNNAQILNIVWPHAELPYSSIDGVIVTLLSSKFPLAKKIS